MQQTHYPKNNAPPVLTNIPSAPPPPPSEMLKDLELESIALKQLHSKISDQLHRLQVFIQVLLMVI